ncbi:hypothetical protein IFM89_016631 [Coptis chinensis]|uniref:Uncharacterized protein n=1 Tax=Coptis chinensis TaxID=261450 RepID=A0A835IRU1_9MAGN|nr:hypothetical protein IFM89_016631 [Coptis chinensis]
MIGYPTEAVNIIPTNFSANSWRSNNVEDHRKEVIHVTSQSSLLENVPMGVRDIQLQSMKLPRSYRVAKAMRFKEEEFQAVDLIVCIEQNGDQERSPSYVQEQHHLNSEANTSAE